jgi:hypothetical protein
MNPPARTPKVLVSLLGALALLVASAGTVGATPPERDGTIHQSLPISSDAFGPGGECGPITSGTAWHFVLNNTTLPTEGSTLTATFAEAGTVTTGVHHVAGGTTTTTSAPPAPTC